MAVNVATIEGLAAAYQTLKALAGEVSVWNVSIARGIEQMDRLRFEAIAPTFLLAVTRREPRWMIEGFQPDRVRGSCGRPVGSIV